MFGRRRKGPPYPVYNNVANVNPSATTAAAQAFLGHRASSTSLSAAAAAAALRARPTTPTNVADVQTKRTMRRANSNSSLGSSLAGSAQGRSVSPLERRTSISSMTERTFREPSPNRGSVQPNIGDAPPVPALPRNIQQPVSATTQRRTASLEEHPTRISSPPLKPNGRGASLGSMTGAQQPNRLGQKANSLTNLQELTGVQRPGSRGSVNFSYPTNSRRAFSAQGYRRLTSPTPSDRQKVVSAQNQNLVYDPNTRSFRPEAELLFIEQSIRDLADRPIKTKKKNASQSAAGSHLADGTVGGRPKGTAMNIVERKPTPRPPEAGQSATTKTTTMKKPEAPLKRKPVPLRNSDGWGGTLSPTGSESDSDAMEMIPKHRSRTGLVISKKPSVIKEREEEDEERRAEDATTKVLGRQTTLNKLESGPEIEKLSSQPTRERGGQENGIVAVPIANADTRQESNSASPPPHSIASSPREHALDTINTGNAVNGEIPGRNKGIAKPDRVQSLSPVRNAHFLTTPEGPTNLVVRHQPPGRSISPRKSAMKHPPSPRGASPIGEVQAGMGHSRGQSASDISDTSTTISDERSVQRKKSVRVSFDDESNVVLGQADTPTATDSPIVLSPQHKRGWLSGIDRNKMKDIVIADEEPDEFMTPRPALPSFGSIREKSRRELSDQPAQKSVEPIIPLPVPSLFTTATGEPIEHPEGFSSDHLVGAIIAQDLAPRNEPNISKFREPLPPEVTSKEESGYASDSESSTHTTEILEKSIETSGKSEDVKQAPVDVAAEAHRKLTIDDHVPDDQETPIAKANGNGNIPIVSVTQATPPHENSERLADWSSIPGGYPASAADSEHDDDQVSISEHPETSPLTGGTVLTERGIFHPHAGEKASHNLHQLPPNSDEADESDDESIYADAAEDLSGMVGDGFMSIDAIVDSPVVPTVPILTLTTPPESPIDRPAKERVHRKSLPAAVSSEPAAAEGWDKAQQYWSGLTAERRKEMEKAAVESPTDLGEEMLAQKPQKKVVVKSPGEEPRTERGDDYRKRNRTYQIVPGTRAEADGHTPTIRSSLRSPPPTDPDDGHVHIRKSMRDAGSGSLRGSMRNNSDAYTPPQPKGSLQKKFRPVSLPVEGRSDHFEVNQYNRNPVAGVTRAAPSPVLAQPTLRRKGSDESESSFKRSRIASDGYNMRRSMRGSVQQQSQERPQSAGSVTSKPQSGRFSFRSLSPTQSGFRKPLSSGSGPPVSMMRATMRDNRRSSSNDSNTPRLMSSSSGRGKSPLRMFSKSKSEGKQKALSKSTSRFADSSDEDEVRPKYRSRYADSSDDEDIIPGPSTPLRQTALRGIPRQAGVDDGDSSDLPDTDDEKPVKSPKANRVLGITGSATNVTATTSDLPRRSGSGRDAIGATTTSATGGLSGPKRPDGKRRGSFMAILRRKNDPASKVRKSEIESAARRDTPLERSHADLMAVKHQDSPYNGSSPKLQKRGQSLRVGSDSWPPPQSGEQDIPAPSNGLLHADGVADTDITLSPKKKKRFGILRRAFGLDE